MDEGVKFFDNFLKKNLKYPYSIYVDERQVIVRIELSYMIYQYPIPRIKVYDEGFHRWFLSHIEKKDFQDIYARTVPPKPIKRDIISSKQETDLREIIALQKKLIAIYEKKLNE